MYKINEGTEGVIYRIDNDRIAKFQIMTSSIDGSQILSRSGHRIKRECGIAKILYDNGISVPKPHDIMTFEHPEFKTQSIYPAFVMDYIKDGLSLKDLGHGPLKKAFEMRDREIRKVMSLGFSPRDYECDKNAIWIPKEEKIFLIDFSRWNIPEELDIF